MSTFAERLKELREEKGISQNQLAKATGFSSGGISNWEAGKSIPNVDVIVKFVKYFECTAGYLIGTEN